MESFKQPDLNLGTNTGIYLESGDVAFKTGGNTRMIIKSDSNKVSIGSHIPTAHLHIEHGSGSDYTNSGLKLGNGSTSYTIYNNSGQDLVFSLDGTVMCYIENSGGTNQRLNFTGQHRNILNTNINDSSRGLIVSSTGDYLNLDNSLGPSINESLPICTISNTDNDKKVFGVISDKEDNNTTRKYPTGNLISVYNKTNTNEERMFINSVGEGSMWVCNKNGTLQNGDYITSTTVSGYGGKQTLNEEFLTRYTVAKITCDCDFSLTKIVKQKLKVTINSDGTTTIDYDSSGNVQYVDDLDSEGNQQMVYKYEMRLLASDGVQLVDEADYNTRLANGESVYIACFVGCTYHCG